MKKPKVIDFFCGSGGLSEGFRQSGCEVVLATDFDENSADTFKENHKDVLFIKNDISELSSEKVMNKANIKSGEIDFVVGGPPCQGFSIAGDRNKDDDRNELFRDFAKHIKNIQPKFFVMENVKGLLSMETPNGVSVIEVMQDKFRDINYRTKYDVLKASDYGVPQNRERVFIIGTRLDNARLNYPEPTHSQNNYITVKQALFDLPFLNAGEKKEKYSQNPTNKYQEYMRSNINKNSIIRNHDAVNHRDHIVERFSHIPQGGNMTDAPEEHQPNKIYSSRNRRLDENKPSHTVTSHVLDELLHPRDNRSLTVREAARLQSFPDDYVFKGSRNVFHGSDETSQYEQVGNAVPVLLARSVARKIISENNIIPEDEIPEHPV